MIFRWRTLALYGAAVLLSLVGHVLAIEGLGRAAAKNERQRATVLAFDLVRQEMPQPAPEPPEPKRPPKPVVPKVVDLTQEPAQASPPPPSAPGPQEPAKARPVFGVSMTSVVGPGTGGGFAVRVGNTVMKAPEQEYTPPDQVGRYQPVPLYKVTRLPAKQSECTATYPPEAKQLGLQGQVLLDVDVLATGEVGAVVLVRGLGHGLDEAAMAALKRCRFSPAVAGGVPVPTRIRYTYTFIIED